MTSAAPPVHVHWPDGGSTLVPPGTDWLQAAAEAGLRIPTGCLGGSCGACEIEVNGRVVRACIATVPSSRSGELTVELATDPYW
ncbi:2Fe-2S iron-sulfur cluster binding domain-containing protein [Synechococcus sp. Cruz-9H2]|uniref:2Fe-2S iron-sulfur cluster-binding protein n=1 Tax=unclassified Synechococcus TaxID=2626047 RepID=UPI0020CD5769|nr:MULTISPECIES: 2Fe-2S iron-sulfur cluster-binding protein [unclassified Synechococcus]MCP9819248.1 2Fe-2S iron-sulfur cluster binding domain-containing protein [Synechococcus sp. Cruz-9H2]MCP9843752.1 2Fe-2S iron-sulfur cluster binding domain-containing protein [Synechococcus sp. Edmonson 11F2]MCP9855529.1 2Fe-2S iron-sulfur cluster binding domain-containing protein [Synechococcus sp. Cruz-9C9]MCP9862967.1 2Fe-2S iron-sulfur cluster binding domain-containing protein [Synechococcus sp. Cruz-7E